MKDLSTYVQAIQNTNSLKEKKELFSEMVEVSSANIKIKTKYKNILKYGITIERKPLTKRIIEDMARNYDMKIRYGVIKCIN